MLISEIGYVVKNPDVLREKKKETETEEVQEYLEENKDTESESEE